MIFQMDGAFKTIINILDCQKNNIEYCEIYDSIFLNFNYWIWDWKKKNTEKNDFTFFF